MEKGPFNPLIVGQNPDQESPVYDWAGVMNFLKGEGQKTQVRELKLIEENSTLKERVHKLEEELQKQLTINKELILKVRRMEYDMRQIKKSPHLKTIVTGTKHKRGNSDGIQNLVSKLAAAHHTRTSSRSGGGGG